MMPVLWIQYLVGAWASSHRHHQPRSAMLGGGPRTQGGSVLWTAKMESAALPGVVHASDP